LGAGADFFFGVSDRGAAVAGRVVDGFSMTTCSVVAFTPRTTFTEV
jgi:ABC-type antimicrobial peptide transport system permease subunit